MVARDEVDALPVPRGQHRVGTVLAPVAELHQVLGVLGLPVPVGVPDAPQPLPVDVGVERVERPQEPLGPRDVGRELDGGGLADPVDGRGRDPVDPLPALVAGEEAPAVITGQADPGPHLIPGYRVEQLRLEARREVEVRGRDRRLASRPALRGVLRAALLGPGGGSRQQEEAEGRRGEERGVEHGEQGGWDGDKPGHVEGLRLPAGLDSEHAQRGGRAGPNRPRSGPFAAPGQTAC